MSVPRETTLRTEGLDLIGQIIEAATGITVAQMRSRTRVKRIFKARVLFSFVAFKHGHTQQDIAVWMKKDRTSIRHQIKKGVNSGDNNGLRTISDFISLAPGVSSNNCPSTHIQKYME